MGKTKAQKQAQAKANRQKINRVKKNVRREVKALESMNGRNDAAVVKRLDNVANQLRTLPKTSQAKLVTSSAFMRLAAWVKQYIVLHAETPPLPSIFKEKVQVHNLMVNFNLTDVYRTPGGFYSFMTQPSFEKFLRVAVPGAADFTGVDDQEEASTNKPVDIGRTPANRLLCSDKTWTVTGPVVGNTELAPVASDPFTVPNSFHWSRQKGTWIDGLKIYPVGSIVSGSEPIIHWKSRSEVAYEAQAVFMTYDAGQTNLHQVTSAWLNVPENAGVDLPFTAGQWNAVIVPDYPVTQFFAYGVQLRPIAPATQIPYMDADVHITIKFGANKFVFGSPLVWKDFSVLDVVCQDPASRAPLEAQYRLASHIKFGLYDLTVQNATPNMAKGGLIASAQFPGGTRASALLKNPDTLFPFLATIPEQSSGTMLFETGQHYFFVPEKTQDWLFKQIVEDEVLKNYLEHDSPKIVSAIYDPPAIGFTSPIIQFKGSVHYELLTYDRSSLQCYAPGNAINQIEQLMIAFRCVPQFTENPNHLKAIGNAIMNVVKSPTFRKIATELTTMGFEMLLA